MRLQAAEPARGRSFTVLNNNLYAGLIFIGPATPLYISEVAIPFMSFAQTQTPYLLLERPHKTALVEEFLNKPLTALRTPALVIDRSVFAENCASMHQRAQDWGASFRAHLKTHKVIIIAPILYYIIMTE